MPDGSNSETKDAVYFLPENTQPGTYHIQLEARSKAGVRKSFVSKPFTVWEGKRNVAVGVTKHKFNHNNTTVKIFVNSVEKGVVPEFTESVTVFDCNDPKCLTFSLPPGDYVVTATNGFSSQDRTLKIVDDFCVRVSFIF